MVPEFEFSPANLNVALHGYRTQSQISTCAYVLTNPLYLHKQYNYIANLCSSSLHNTIGRKRSELQGSIARHPFLLKEIKSSSCATEFQTNSFTLLVLT